MHGKAPSDMPALQPYWGKPAVRNDRGHGGNVGIIRRPLCATVLPDETGAVVAVTVASGYAGDTATILETLPQAGENIAERWCASPIIKRWANACIRKARWRRSAATMGVTGTQLRACL